MNVALNTDNRLMSDTTLTDEYFFAARHLDFTIDELCTIALNGFESAFIPWEERTHLIDQVTSEMTDLIEEAA